VNNSTFQPLKDRLRQRQNIITTYYKTMARAGNLFTMLSILLLEAQWQWTQSRSKDTL